MTLTSLDIVLQLCFQRRFILNTEERQALQGLRPDVIENGNMDFIFFRERTKAFVHHRMDDFLYLVHSDHPLDLEVSFTLLSRHNLMV